MVADKAANFIFLHNQFNIAALAVAYNIESMLCRKLPYAI